MELIRAIVLGVVQGITEFLPISSSGHLILVRWLFDWPDEGIAFDVGLHMGTLVAILGYFWRDWLEMAFAGVSDFGRHRLRFRDHSPESQLLWLIAVGSIPAAVTGLLFGDWIEANVRQPWFVAVMLIAFGGVLLLADRGSSQWRTTRSIGLADALLVGGAQALALFPGVSRSGVTMSAALFRGLAREDAARFAFLLGTPTFVGAGLLSLKDLSGSNIDMTELAVGFVTSMLVGFAAIAWLLGFLRRRSVEPFVTYRLGAGVVTLALVAVRAVL